MSTTTKPSLTDKLKTFLEEHGPIALWVYFSIFGLVLLGFFLAARWGFEAGGASDSVGVWGALGAAYVATKATQPLRIGATFLLTPAVGVALRRRKKTLPQRHDTPQG